MGTIGIRDLSRNASRVIDQVSSTGSPMIVTKRGRPVAAVVAVDPDALEDFVLATAPEYVAARQRRRRRPRGRPHPARRHGLRPDPPQGLRPAGGSHPSRHPGCTRPAPPGAGTGTRPDRGRTPAPQRRRVQPRHQARHRQRPLAAPARRRLEGSLPAGRRRDPRGSHHPPQRTPTGDSHSGVGPTAARRRSGKPDRTLGYRGSVSPEGAAALARLGPPVCDPTGAFPACRAKGFCTGIPAGRQGAPIL